MSRGPRKGAFIPVNCDGCGVVFWTRRCKVLGFNKLYHNRECYRNNGTTAGGGIARSKYLTHYFCASCGTWIPHKLAILHTSKSEKSRYPICPNYEKCGKYKLNTRPRNSKWNKKLREQLKKIQLQKEKENEKLLVTNI